MCSKRNCSTVEPAGHMTIEKLPRSNDEAKAKTEASKQYNLKEGLDVRYDVFGDPEKWQRVSSPEYTSAPRLANLFSKLRAAQSIDSYNDDL